jgi:hypothetical protein
MSSAVDEMALEQVFVGFLRFSPANYHSTIASNSSYAGGLDRQYIIISSASKFGASFLTRHLDG